MRYNYATNLTTLLPQTQMPRFNPILDQLATYPQQALNQQKAKVRAAGITMYDFGVGDPNEAVPAFILKALKDAVVAHSSYPSVMGPQALRDAVVDYVGRRFGVELDAEQHILPVSGTKEAVFICRVPSSIQMPMIER